MDIPYENLGALPRPADPRDFPLGAAQLPTPRPTVFTQDISWLHRNYQGQTPWCGEHSGSHFKAVLDFAILGTKGRFTPRYGAIKLKDPKSPVYDGYSLDAGTDMRSIFKWLQKLGANSFEPLENDVTLTLPQYAEPSVVTPAMDANAATSVISSYAFTATDFESVCQAAYQNKAVLLLIKCDDGFWGTNTPTFTTPKYGHFVVAFDYDENQGYVRAIDSADPSDALAIKKIKKEYFQPQFILEAGTALELPPSVHQALSVGQISLAQQILLDIEKILHLDQLLAAKKVVPQITP
jgi:hypothetical protein